MQLKDEEWKVKKIERKEEILDGYSADSAKDYGQNIDFEEKTGNHMLCIIPGRRILHNPLVVSQEILEGLVAAANCQLV